MVRNQQQVGFVFVEHSGTLPQTSNLKNAKDTEQKRTMTTTSASVQTSRLQTFFLEPSFDRGTAT